MANESQTEDIRDKIILVTGANSGIGFEACRHFAARGACVLMVCRNKARGTRAMELIQGESPNAKLALFITDFCSLQEISELAAQLRATYPRIDILCNNAGAANARRVVTAEGFETTFVANHLSGFLLTRLLLPTLLLSAEQSAVRVIFTSSLGHKNSPLDFDDLELNEGYGTLKAYGRSKLMNLLTARSLHQRYGAMGIIASSFHPGAVRTAIWGKGGALATFLGFVMYPFMWSVEKGADTLIWLATSNDEAARKANGHYFFDRKTASTAPFATDEAAERLWKKSEELLAKWLPDHIDPLKSFK